MTKMNLKKFKVLSNAHRPKTHCRHAQVHQWANALTGSINIFQSTVIIVYEVEHQKTVNKKLGKQTIWFSELIKYFSHYSQPKVAERHNKIESNVELHSESLSIVITKSYG